MDPMVAEGFARGHRIIPVPDPVVAEAVVEREAGFAVVKGRNESELLIDLRRLCKLVVRKWEGKTILEELRDRGVDNRGNPTFRRQLDDAASQLGISSREETGSLDQICHINGRRYNSIMR
jgi:hypothetical protein